MATGHSTANMKTRPANWHLTCRHRMKKIRRALCNHSTSKLSSKKLTLASSINQQINQKNHQRNKQQQFKTHRAQALQHLLVTLPHRPSRGLQKCLHNHLGQPFYACNSIAVLRKTAVAAKKTVSDTLLHQQVSKLTKPANLVIAQSTQAEANHSNTIKFDCSGTRLASSDNSALTAENMVIIAQLRGWGEISTCGHEVFRRAVWFAGAARGMLVRGFVPTEQDKVELAQQMPVSDYGLIRLSYRPQGATEAIIHNPITIIARQIRDNAIKSLAISGTASNEINTARF